MVEDKGRIIGYRDSEVARLLPKGHQGLVFDRYLPLWAMGDDGEWQIPSGQIQRALQKFAHDFPQAADEAQPLLDHVHARQTRILELRQGRRLELRSTSPLVIGLGIDHPTENGFLFDPVIGVPWIPATAVKGLCRRGAALLDVKQEVVEKALGGTTDDCLGVGDLVFLDAYPASWPELEVQVLTAHYSSYQRWLGNESKKKPPNLREAPHGLDSPVPVHHLSVARRVAWHFGLFSRSGDSRLIDQALEWLTEALEWLGAGGRTAVGFGYFEGDSQAPE